MSLNAAEALPVEAGRGGGRSGQPVEHDVVEHFVEGENIQRVAVAVGPGPELFQDPGGLAERGIGEGIAHRLRPGGLLFGIAGVPGAVVLETVQRALFGRGRGVGNLRAGTHCKRDMDAGAVRRILPADALRDGRAPVAALREIAGVAEALHKSRPGLRDALHAPAGDRWFAGQAITGQRGAHDMEGVGSRAAEAHRIDQRLDNLVEFHDGTGPAVRDQQRYGLGVR